MKTFQDKLNEIARTIGKDKTTLSTNSEPFDYQKQRAEYELINLSRNLKSPCCIVNCKHF